MRSGKSKQVIVFPVVGLTGTGKSTFINIALGESVTPVGHGAKSPFTEKPVPIIIDPIPNRPLLKDRRLVLLDTPGFDATLAQDAEIYDLIAGWLKHSRMDGARVGGVLYIHDISAKRSSNNAPLSRLCDPTTMLKTVLITTNWSSNSDDVLVKRELEMRETYWKASIDKGLRIFRFHQTYSEAWDIINHLLDNMSDLDVPFAIAPSILPVTMSSKGRELGPNDIVFPVVGPSGTGKSTFINIAKDKNVTKVGHGTTGPCTTQPFPIIIDTIPNRPELSGYRLVLLDTPGFDATHTNDVETFNRIAKWLEASRKSGARIGGVIYVYDISVKRSNAKAPLSRLRVPTAMPKTALVTTNWSSYPDGVLVRREHEMKETHWKAFIDQGLPVFQFHQTSSEAWGIINYLLDHMGDLDVPLAMTMGDEKFHTRVYFENLVKWVSKIFAS